MHYRKPPEVDRTWHVYCPPTLRGTGHSWSKWNLQLRRPVYKEKKVVEQDKVVEKNTRNKSLNYKKNKND